MLEHLFSRFRRQAPRMPTHLADPRSGAPVTRGPDPMPRMRWYS
jgi:hypothetical protein